MSLEVQNFYQKIKEKDEKWKHYPLEDKIKIKLPFRMLWGSGKSNCALDVIDKIKIFTTIVLVAKHPDQGLYADYFIPKYRALEKKHGIRILMVLTSPSQLPPIESFDPKQNNLVIFDDLICESPKDLRKVEDFYIRRRHRSISMIFQSQSYFATPKKIQQNCSLLMLKQLAGIRDLKMILKDHSLDKSPEEMIQLWKKAVQGGFTSFMLIDMEAMDPAWRYRRNYLPIEN